MSITVFLHRNALLVSKWLKRKLLRRRFSNSVEYEVMDHYGRIRAETDRI